MDFVTEKDRKIAVPSRFLCVGDRGSQLLDTGNTADTGQNERRSCPPASRQRVFPYREDPTE